MKEFEPRPPAKSQEMCQAFLSPAKSDESMQMVRQQESGLMVCEEQPGDKVSVLQPGRPMAWDLSTPGSDGVPQSKPDVQDVWKHGSHRPGIVR